MKRTIYFLMTAIFSVFRCPFSPINRLRPSTYRVGSIGLFLVLLILPAVSQAQCSSPPGPGLNSCTTFTIDASSTPVLIPGGTVSGTIGNGNGCNGDIDAVFVQETTPGSITCTDQNVAGSGVIYSYNVATDATEVLIIVCRFSGGNPNICGISTAPPCEFEVTCGAADLGTYDCTTLSDIPAAPTVMTNAGDITVDNADGDYGIDIGDTPCGTIIVEVEDDPATPADACGPADYIVTRTITIIDDEDNSGDFTAGEEMMDCEYTYTIDVDNVPPVMAIPADGVLACSPTPPTAPATIGVTDNCDVDTTIPLENTEVVGNCREGFTAVFTYGPVTDACGNIALAQSFTISTTPCDCTEETNIQTCDDNDPCTINDMVTLACDDSVCVPCAGELIGPPIPSLTCPPAELDKCATDGSNTFDCMFKDNNPLTAALGTEANPIIGGSNPGVVSNTGIIDASALNVGTYSFTLAYEAPPGCISDPVTCTFTVINPKSANAGSFPRN